MAYTPPDRRSLDFRLSGAYSPPDRHGLVFDLPENSGVVIETGQAQGSAATGSVVLVGTAATGQRQSTSGAAELVLLASIETGQRQSVTGSAVAQISGSAQTGQRQTCAGTGAVAVVGSAETGQRQSTAGSAQLATGGSIATGQVQSVDASGLRYGVRRSISGTAGLPWQQASGRAQAVELASQRGAYADASVRIANAPATPRDAAFRLRWGIARMADRAVALAWQRAGTVDRAWRFRWQAALPQDVQRRLPWQQARARDHAPLRLDWRVASPRDVQRVLPWKRGDVRDVQRALPWALGKPLDQQRRLPWNLARPVPWEVRPPLPPRPPVPPPPGCYAAPDHHFLRFDIRPRGFPAYLPPDRHALTLDIRCLPSRTLDVRSTLVIQHSISVVRLPDRLPLHVTGGTMRLDRASWSWSADLAFADAASLVAVEPTPAGLQAIEINVDGWQWIMVVDSYTEDRQQGRRGGSVRATSPTVQLAAPYAPQRAFINSADITAQQLVLDELGFSGIGLDWQIDDWLVPAGAFSYQQESPLSATLKIAGAAGAMLQSSMDGTALIVAPRAPAAAWTLGDLEPDFSIVGGSWRSVGKRWNSGSRYNGVYVSGQSQGVLCHVYRDGTDGSPEAPLVVDPLITDTVAGRVRGIDILNNSLPRHEIPIELPLLASGLAPGLLLPGELGLIEDTVWGEFRAVVDSLAVSFSVSQTGQISASQSATLWRYLP